MAVGLWVAVALLEVPEVDQRRVQTALIRRAVGDGILFHAGMLRPASRREILARVLRNLKVARLGRPHIRATARPHWRFTECFNLLLSCAAAPPGVHEQGACTTRRGNPSAGGWETGDASTLTTE